MPEPDEAPPLDPERVVDAYRRARARRLERIARRRRRKLAGVRFWLTLVLLLVAALAIAYGVWLELQDLIGD